MKDCVHCTSSIPDAATTCPECGGNVSAAVAAFAGFAVAAISAAIGVVWAPAWIGVLVGAGVVVYSVAVY